MATLSSAISLYTADVNGSSIGQSNTVYVSIPDPTATSTAGDQCQGLGLLTLPTGVELPVRRTRILSPHERDRMDTSEPQPDNLRSATQQITDRSREHLIVPALLYVDNGRNQVGGDGGDGIQQIQAWPPR